MCYTFESHVNVHVKTGILHANKLQVCRIQLHIWIYICQVNITTFTHTYTYKHNAYKNQSNIHIIVNNKNNTYTTTLSLCHYYLTSVLSLLFQKVNAQFINVKHIVLFYTVAFQIVGCLVKLCCQNPSSVGLSSFIHTWTGRSKTIHKLWGLIWNNLIVPKQHNEVCVFSWQCFDIFFQNQNIVKDDPYICICFTRSTWTHNIMITTKARTFLYF